MNSRDCYNHTPLMEAAGFEMLKYLVEVSLWRKAWMSVRFSLT